MKISSLGEFDLIEKIKKWVEKKNLNKKNIIVGIGDDTAVVAENSKRYLLATTDMLVEDIHFRKKTASLKQIGWKALACNLSDIAAMGGIPLYALISIGLPNETTVNEVENIYQGIQGLADKYQVIIIGGDTVSSPLSLVISITLLGEIEKENLIRRSGAKPGDKILVTGSLGDAAGGLSILERYTKKQWSLKNHLRYIVGKCLLPEPKISVGRIIAENRYATAMIDCSDGLDVSLKLICRQSKVGAKIKVDSIPLSTGLLKAKKMLDTELIDFALFGGEDYELIFTVDKNKVEEVIKKIPGLSIIGEITDEKKGIKFLDKKGKIVRVKGKGYEHFTNTV